MKSLTFGRFLPTNLSNPHKWVKKKETEGQSNLGKE